MSKMLSQVLQECLHALYDCLGPQQPISKKEAPFVGIAEYDKHARTPKKENAWQRRCDRVGAVPNVRSAADILLEAARHASGSGELA